MRRKDVRGLWREPRRRDGRPLLRRREGQRERSENRREDEARDEGAFDRVVVAELDRFMDSMRDQSREQKRADEHGETAPSPGRLLGHAPSIARSGPTSRQGRTEARAIQRRWQRLRGPPRPIPVSTRARAGTSTAADPPRGHAGHARPLLDTGLSTAQPCPRSRATPRTPPRSIRAFGRLPRARRLPLRPPTLSCCDAAEHGRGPPARRRHAGWVRPGRATSRLEPSTDRHGRRLVVIDTFARLAQIFAVK
jgi:hypothetical protein